MYSFVVGMSKKLELTVELLESGTKFDVTAIKDSHNMGRTKVGLLTALRFKH